MTYVRCPGCGVKFKGERGLRAHQSQKHLTMACRPSRLPTPDPGLPDPDEERG